MKPAWPSITRHCIVAVVGASLLAPGPVWARSTKDPSRTPGQAATGQQVLKVLDEIFTGFVTKDRDAITRRHAFDWIGYGRTGARVDKGLEEFMQGADLAFASPYRPTGHQILDSDVKLRSGMAVVPYTARYAMTTPDGKELQIVFRALDVFRRDGSGWQQVASNLCTLLDDPPRYPAPLDFQSAPPLRLFTKPPEASTRPSEKARLSWKDHEGPEDARRAIGAAVASHVRAILDRDRVRLASLASREWAGFTLFGAAVARGRDGGLDGINSPWGRLEFDSLQESETQIYDGLGFVLSTFRARSVDAARPVVVRSLHVLQKEGRGWVVLSNDSCVFPEPDQFRQ
jgi:ketosteroid isomerase-like protein